MKITENIKKTTHVLLPGPKSKGPLLIHPTPLLPPTLKKETPCTQLAPGSAPCPGPDQALGSLSSDSFLFLFQGAPSKIQCSCTGI